MSTHNIYFCGEKAHLELRINRILFIPCHTIVAGCCGFKLDISMFVRLSVRILFQDHMLSKH